MTASPGAAVAGGVAQRVAEGLVPPVGVGADRQGSEAGDGAYAQPGGAELGPALGDGGAGQSGRLHLDHVQPRRRRGRGAARFMGDVGGEPVVSATGLALNPDPAPVAVRVPALPCDPRGLGLVPSPRRRLRTGAGLVSRCQRCNVSSPGR